jgi:hypothetical protein
MMLRALAVPFLVLAVGVIATLISVHPSNLPALQHQAPAICNASKGSGITGTLPLGSGYGHSIVQILPAAPYGALYLDAVRRRLGIPVVGATISGGDVMMLTKVLRYTAADASGRFVCRPLDPGKYIAVATTTGLGGRVAVEVAAFNMGTAHGLASLNHDSFRPIQDFR